MRTVERDGQRRDEEERHAEPVDIEADPNVLHGRRLKVPGLDGSGTSGAARSDVPDIAASWAHSGKAYERGGGSSVEPFPSRSKTGGPAGGTVGGVIRGQPSEPVLHHPRIRSTIFTPRSCHRRMPGE
jgi:hypothetical protein